MTTTRAPATGTNLALWNTLQRLPFTDATIPTTHRWIPVGMTVEYRSKATTAVTSVARLDPIPEFGDDPTDLVVPVDVLDADGNAFVTARITMHVSKKR